MINNSFNELYDNKSKLVVDELTRALSRVNPKEVEQLMDMVRSAEKVYFTGVGRVLLSLEAIAKRWAHIGVETHVVGEITEPAITEKDILIVGSGSGNSLLPVAIARKAASLGAKVIHIGSNPCGDISQVASLMVRIPVRTKLSLEDELDSEQPMTSLFEQTLLVLGDVIAMLFIEQESININELWKFHANLE